MSKATQKRGPKFRDAAEYQTLASMRKGTSRFYEGVRPVDMGSVRRMVAKLKMKVLMRYTDEDPETQGAGTRMWCMEPADKTVLKHIERNSEDEQL